MEKVSKKSPLISVVVPVYKVEEYLNRCVDSIIVQTYKNLEIILVDDGSPDNCGQICDDYAKKDRRIKVIHKENGGLSDARNNGIELSKGKYITFIDSDDYIENNYISVLYKSISSNNTDIAISSHKVVYDNGVVINKATEEESVLKPKEVLKRILYDDGIDLSAWSKLYKKELFDDIKYPKGRLFEDAATTYKLIDKSNKISICSFPTYNYIIRNNSITNVRFTTKKMDLITSTEEMTDYVKIKYPDLKQAADRRLMYAYLSTLSQLAMSDKTFPEEEEKIIRYIKKNGNKQLMDKNVPLRDKIGILCARVGFDFYKIVWSIYTKFTGRAK